jgi:hypothetical protein
MVTLETELRISDFTMKMPSKESTFAHLKRELISIKMTK